MAMTSASRDTQVVTVDLDGRVFTMERVFDAPPERVFAAFSSCDRIARWWGPSGWVVPFCEMDFRPGGRWRYAMRGPDGTESWGLALYREIVAPSMLAYRDNFTDAAGTIQPGSPDMAVSLELIDLGGRTRLVSTARFETRADLESVIAMGMERGLTETWDRLEAEVATAA